MSIQINKAAITNNDVVDFFVTLAYNKIGVRALGSISAPVPLCLTASVCAL